MRPFRLDLGENPEGLLEVVAQEAIAGIMAFDPASKICTDINRVARETLEIGIGEELGGRPLRLRDLIPAETRNGLALPFSEEMFRAEGLFQDVLIRKTNGHFVIANVAVKHVTLANGVQRTLVMFQDISIEKKMHRDLELKKEEIRNAYARVLEQNHQLKELDSAKDRFIALTTHELRTPLSAIVATAEVLHMKLFESEEQRDQFITTIYEQGLHLMELVNDILDFAKIRAGKMELFVELVDVGGLAAKLAAGFDHMASQSKVKIFFDSPGAEIKAYVDVLRLKEVINNVVNNAIKYNRPGGDVRISCQILESEKRARVTVADTGLGIPENRLHCVFNEFETVGHVSSHHKGTGLGMPISKRLMEAMGGGLSLTSVEGKGTSFFIDIPLEKVLAPETYRARADSWSDQAA